MALEQQVLALGDKAIHVQADVSKTADLQKLVDAAVSSFGRLDIIVNNAGVETRTSVLDTTEEQYQRVLDINLKSAFFGTQIAAKQMIAQGGGGRIINITSVVALMGNPGQANYSAAKAGVIGLTRSNAAEFAARGVTVNAVAPGFIESDMTAELDKEPILAAIPLGRMGSAAEVAGAVRFLAADPAAAYITGQVLQVDGGMVMR